MSAPSDNDIGLFWHEFPGSRPQKVLLHELELMIESERSLLECCEADALLKHQANILALRKLANILRRKENPR